MITRFANVIRLPVGVFPLFQRRTAFIALTVLPSVSCISGQVASSRLSLLPLVKAESDPASVASHIRMVLRQFLAAVCASVLLSQFPVVFPLLFFLPFSTTAIPSFFAIRVGFLRTFVTEDASIQRIRILLVALHTAVSRFVISVDFGCRHGSSPDVAGMAGFGPARNRVMHAQYGLLLPPLSSWHNALRHLLYSAV